LFSSELNGLQTGSQLRNNENCNGNSTRNFPEHPTNKSGAASVLPLRPLEVPHLQAKAKSTDGAPQPRLASGT
jgi:hypothetical protein